MYIEYVYDRQYFLLDDSYFYVMDDYGNAVRIGSNPNWVDLVYGRY